MARSRGQLSSFTSAVAKAISDADDQDAVAEVRKTAPRALGPAAASTYSLSVLSTPWHLAHGVVYSGRLQVVDPHCLRA
jgi:hypothetical protein